MDSRGTISIHDVIGSLPYYITSVFKNINLHSTGETNKAPRSLKIRLKYYKLRILSSPTTCPALGYFIFLLAVKVSQWSMCAIFCHKQRDGR